MTRGLEALFAAFLLAVTSCQVGCAALTQGSSLQSAAEMVTKDVIGPAMNKAIGELNTDAAHLSGQVSGINPGYKVEGYAVFGTGLVYDVTVRTEGVSANVAGATQAHEAAAVDGQGGGAAEGE